MYLLQRNNKREREMSKKAWRTIKSLRTIVKEKELNTTEPILNTLKETRQAIKKNF